VERRRKGNRLNKEEEEKEEIQKTKINSTGSETGIDFGASTLLFENLEWLSTSEAAIYLRRFEADGKPSLNAIHKLVSKGTIRRRKFEGRLYFKRKELSYLIECSA